MILALDLYLKHRPKIPSAAHPDIVELSQILNALPIHANQLKESNFRNSNGVTMKISNFLRLDPTYEGKGLTRGNQLEEKIWQEFSANPSYLKEIALNIKSCCPEEPVLPSAEEEEETFSEGKILYKMHRSRERNRILSQKVKAMAKANGTGLKCSVCGFDFAEKYGLLGQDFIECHHTLPLSEYHHRQETRINDIALVCANCHRMLHKKKTVADHRRFKSDPNKIAE